MMRLDFPNLATQFCVDLSASTALPAEHYYSAHTQAKWRSSASFDRALQIKSSRWLLAKTIAQRMESDAYLTLKQLEETPVGPKMPGLDLHTSIAHGRNNNATIACASAISRTPIGIDLERFDPKRPLSNLAKRLFPASEQAWIFAHAELVETRFYSIWTLREAAIKAGHMRLISDLPALAGPDGLKPSFPYVLERFESFCVAAVLNPR
jgi:4'-phosphopantetheinyl transferase